MSETESSMLNVVVGHSQDPDSLAAIDEILKQCQASLKGSIPKAGVLLTAINFDHQLFLTRINETFPGIELIGGTTSGETSSILGFQEDSAILLLLCSDDIEMRAVVIRNLSQNMADSVQQALTEITATEKPIQLCLTCVEGLLIDAVSFVNHLSQALGDKVPIFGGMTADDWQFIRTYQFFRTEVLQDAASILLFFGDLLVSFGVATGVEPVSNPGIVTKSVGDTVYEIDGERALNFYTNYFEHDAFIVKATTALAVSEVGESNVYVRYPKGSDASTGSINFIGHVPEQATVRWTKSDRTSLLEAVNKAFQHAWTQYPGQQPSVAIVVSCASRLKNLGTRTKEEYILIQQNLGQQIPIIGYHAFGEISPFDVKGRTFFHNETFVALLLGTK